MRWGRRGTVAAVVVAFTTVTVLGSGVRITERHGEVDADDTSLAVQRDDGRTWQVVPFEPGRTAIVEFEVEHRGALPVTLVGLTDSRARGTVDCGWNLEHATAEGEGGDGTRGTPLPEGVELRRGDRITITVRGRFVGEPGCLVDGQVSARPTFLADVSVLGLRHRQRLQPPRVLAWSTDPAEVAERWTHVPVAPRVGTVP